MIQSVRSIAPAHVAGGSSSTPHWPTLVDALVSAADDARLYVDMLDTRNQSHPLSFAAALEGAERFAHALVQHGLKRGGRVVILLPTGRDFLFALFGTQLAGGIPVPLPMPLGFGAIDAYVAGLAPVVNNARPDLFVTTHRAEHGATEIMGARGLPDAVLLPDHLEPVEPAGPLPRPEPDDIALVQYTSGSWSAPTGVTLTHRQVLANVDGVGRVLKLGETDVAVSWIPLVHDMGLIGVLFSSLYWRYPTHLMPPESFLMHPQRWVQNIGRFGATLSAAPNFAYQLAARRVTPKHLEGLDLSRWRVALNGAEMVQPETIRAFCERLQPAGFNPGAICPIYGLAENTLAATCPRPGVSYEVTPIVREDLPKGSAAAMREVVGVGYPLPGQEVAIVDAGVEADPVFLYEEEIGEVVVRGDCVMQGYLDNPMATRRRLRGGWLHTGDLGFISDGRLFITGRKKQMVIKMGRNYYPADIEAVVQRILQPGAAAMAFPTVNPRGGTEDLVVVAESSVEAPEARKELQTAVNAALLETLAIRADRFVLVPIGSLPLAPSQTERRKLVQERFAQGHWTPATGEPSA